MPWTAICIASWRIPTNHVREPKRYHKLLAPQRRLSLTNKSRKRTDDSPAYRGHSSSFFFSIHHISSSHDFIRATIGGIKRY